MSSWPRHARAVALVRWLAIVAAMAVTAPASAERRLPVATGEPLVIEHPAERVITLAPNLAELVWAAGAGETLVGTVAWSDYPEAVTRLPQIGDAFRFDLEKILALSPDLVIAWESGNPAPALESIEALGLPVWRTDIQAPMEIASLVAAIGVATGHEATANAAAGAFQEQLAALEAAWSDRTPVTYFYQVAERPLYTLAGRHLVSQSLALCGGENIFSGLDELAPQVAVEAVMAADPEVMFAGRFEGSGDPLAHWRKWPRLRAVREDALYTLPADLINRATPRMLDAVEQACKLFDQYRSRPPRSDRKQTP